MLDHPPTANKPRGLQAARKLRTTRRENRWADKDYNKRALGNIYKTSPTGGSSHAKGIVLEKVGSVDTEGYGAEDGGRMGLLRYRQRRAPACQSSVVPSEACGSFSFL